MQKTVLNKIIFTLLDNMVWLLCLISIIAFPLLSEDFLTPRTLLTIIPRVAAIGLLVIGQSFTMLTGHFDLSSESVVGLCAFVGALLIASPNLVDGGPCGLQHQ